MSWDSADRVIKIKRKQLTERELKERKLEERRKKYREGVLRKREYQQALQGLSIFLDYVFKHDASLVDKGVVYPLRDRENRPIYVTIERRTTK
jgi:hypothetical protein